MNNDTYNITDAERKLYKDQILSLKEFIQNIMALDLKLKDMFTFKQGEIKNHNKMILTMLKKKKYGFYEIVEIKEVSDDYMTELLKKSPKERLCNNISFK